MRAEKVGGSYQATGTVLVRFKTSTGKELVVFEFDTYPGMVHIFAPEQLVVYDEAEEDLKSCF